MGITYQTGNRQRRKVMTAPLNAPPADLVEDRPEALPPHFEAAPAGRGNGKLWWIVGLGAAAAAVAARFAL